MDQLEEWRSISGFEGYYEISNLGNVRSVTRSNGPGRMFNGKPIKASIDKYGYEKVVLSKHCKPYYFTVHRLVLLTFMPPSDTSLQVNHINGVKTDNGVSNLEWCTFQENINHATRTGLRKNLFKIGEHNKGKTGPWAKLILNLETGIFYESGPDAAEAHNVVRSTLRSRLNGRIVNKTPLVYC